MRTTKIQISPAMREFNEQIEHADFLLDYQFDRESADTLLMRLKQARCYPASALALEKAMAGIAVRKYPQEVAEGVVEVTPGNFRCNI